MSKLFGKKFNEFELEVLDLHNAYRKEHGVPRLELSKEICKISQQWAEELAKKDVMSHSLNTNYGENIYCGWSSDPKVKINAKDCVDKWYNEINDFSFGKEPTLLKCGHFTQIIWKSSKQLGVGQARSTTGKTYVVTNYSPPGNYSGQFTANVPPPGANQFKSANDYGHSSKADEEKTKIVSKNITEIVEKLSTTSINEFEKDFLSAHNEYRSKHGVPPLILSRKLCEYAKDWAEKLSRANRMEHRDQNNYGENIFFSWSTDPNFRVSGREPVDKWYSEIKDHNFGEEPSSLATGHFTQVVWEDTKEVGVGVCKNAEGKVYVVANYYPPGNVIGSFSSKVRPLE